MLLGTAANTLECLWALRIIFCADNWKKLTGHSFISRSRGAYLFVTTVTIECLLGSTRDTKRRIEGPEAGRDREAYLYTHS